MSEVYTFPTLQTVRDQAVNECLGGSLLYPTALQDAALIRELNVINSEFVNAPYLRNYSGWKWMEEITNFQSKAATTLNGALTTSSTSIILTSATDFDSSGRVWSETGNGALDFMDYTGKSSNTLTGATGIDIAHASGDSVEKLYALPSNFGKSRTLYLNGSEYTFVDSSNYLIPPSGYYTTQGAYIFLPENVGAQDATLRYMKKPTNVSTGVIGTDLATSMDVPVRYARFAVERLKAYIYSITRHPDKQATALQLAQGSLEEAFTYSFRQTASPTARLSVTW